MTKIKDAEGTLNRQPVDPPRLHVSAMVETTNSNQTPHLEEASPPGINPTILILNLTIASSGIGNEVMGWKPVEFHKKPANKDLKTVDIHFGGKSIEKITLKVLD